MTELPPWFVPLFAFLFGAVVGSFLNVCVHRWPRGESVVRPRSRCAACASPIAWRDNVPVLGWLLLRGRCRVCGVRISPQYPLVEAAVALIWLAAALRFGPTIGGLHSAVFLTLLLGIALTDARFMVIPDQFTVVGGAIGLAFAALPGGPPFVPVLVGAALGVAIMTAVKFGAEAALRKPALGTGDIFMIGMIGAFLGVSGMLLTIMLGAVLGLLIGVPLLWLRGRLRALQTYLPLGTFLALGAALAHGWGDVIVGWYIHSVLGL